MSAYWLPIIIAIQSSPLWLLLANTIVVRALYRPLQEPKKSPQI